MVYLTDEVMIFCIKEESDPEEDKNEKDSNPFVADPSDYNRC